MLFQMNPKIFKEIFEKAYFTDDSGEYIEYLYFLLNLITQL